VIDPPALLPVRPPETALLPLPDGVGLVAAMSSPDPPGRCPESASLADAPVTTLSIAHRGQSPSRLLLPVLV